MANSCIWRQCSSDRLSSSDLVDCNCSEFRNSEMIADDFFETGAVLKTWNGSKWIPKPLYTYKGSIFVHKPLMVNISGTWELVRS